MIIIQSQEKYYPENVYEKTQGEIDSKIGESLQHKDKNTIQTETIPIASQLKQINNINEDIDTNRSPNLPRANTFLTMHDNQL